MKLSIRYILFFLTILLGCKPKERSELIPMEDFFRNPDKIHLQISPDGEHIAYLQPYKDRLNIFVLNIATNKEVRLTSEIKRGITKFFWANDEQILFLKDRDGDEYFHLFSVNKNGEDLKDLTPFEKVKIRFFDTHEKNGNILVGFNKRDAEVFDLFRLNIISGKYNMVEQNPGNISYWKADHTGKARLAVETDGVNENILFRESESSAFTRIFTLNFKETLYPISFSPDNKRLYAVSNIGRDKMALVEFDPKTGKETEVIYANPDVDVSNMDYSSLTKLPLYCMYTTWKVEVKFLNEEFQKVNSKIQKQLPGKLFTITSFSRDENRFLIKTYTDKTLGAYFLYDKHTDKLNQVCEISPWIKESQMADVNPIRLKSRDGLTLNGYLTLPKNAEAKNLPLIVNPHGGPWSRDRWGYNSEVQFLANRGYAVLQVNYRGSSGYGKQFMQAGFKEIGSKTQDDITDAVRYLIAKGIVDSSRIGIFGFSFGGYFALNGLVKDSGLYKCAVSYCGIPNLFAFVKEIPPYYKQYLKMTYEMFGNPEIDAEYFRENSPVFHADRISVPVLIAQGAKDSRVSADEVSLFVKTLKKRSQKVNYILLENEGHGFQNQENKFMFYSQMEEFLNENLSGN